MSEQLNAETLAAVLASFTGMFFRGVKSKYAPTGAHQDKLYFATDTHELLVNGTAYGGGGIDDVELEGDTLKFTLSDGTEKTVSIAAIVNYDSAMVDSLATVEDFGGIPAGTTAATLKAKTISQVLDDLLFPTVQPTKVDPTATIALKSGFANGGNYEVGAPAPQKETNFTLGYTLGEVRIAGAKKQDYAGAPTAQVLYFGNSEAATTLPTTIAEGSNKYTHKVTFGQGPQPLDSKGGNATSVTRYAAGGTKSASVAINGVYPYFATTTDISTLSKLALTNGTTFTFNAPSEETGKRHAFAIPAKYTVSSVKMLNTLSGKYEEVDFFDDGTEEERTVQSVQVDYKQYKKTSPVLGAEATYQVTIVKS